MTRLRHLIAACVCLTLALPLSAASPDFGSEPIPGLSGMVHAERAPIARVQIYAYALAEPQVRRVHSDASGRFFFGRLPAGVYKIIAYKSGFVPAVIMLKRVTMATADFLEFELVEESRAAMQEEDFWSIRRKIPTDVLREIRLAEAAEAQSREIRDSEPGDRFETEMQAMAGFDNLGGAQTQLTESRVDMRGRVGSMMLHLDGLLQERRARSQFSDHAPGMTTGETRAISLSLAGSSSSKIRVSTLDHDMQGGGRPQGDGFDRDMPVNMQRFQVDWSQQHGKSSQSQVSARYFEESNFNTLALLAPVNVPSASRAWEVEGAYSHQLTDRVELRTGVSFQELVALAGDLDSYLSGDPLQSMEAFGIATHEVSDGILVEYGLYSALRDGSVAFTPQGSVLVDLPKGWQADALWRQKVVNEEVAYPDYGYVLYDDHDRNVIREDHYYRAGLHRHSEEDGELLRVGIAHREVDSTMRLFFDEDLFDQAESIYLVDGDEVPELDFALSRKLGKSVMTTIESTYATGGGGLFRSVDQSYENRVSYLVTSLGTQFLDTSTGVLLAFHRLAQDLEPLDAGQRASEMELDRLQLRLTQELGMLLNIGTELAVLLNLEVSRGGLPYSTDFDSEELHSRVAGGIAVRF